jgi:hypothetical protein
LAWLALWVDSQAKPLGPVVSDIEAAIVVVAILVVDEANTRIGGFGGALVDDVATKQVVVAEHYVWRQRLNVGLQAL